jgi:hypothetical protein
VLVSNGGAPTLDADVCAGSLLMAVRRTLERA